MAQTQIKEANAAKAAVLGCGLQPAGFMGGDGCAMAQNRAA
jgi:hypothetical protein